jgi:catechol 2,3-dioxygenase-like lactoylglutathione lyase family enzyme
MKFGYTILYVPDVAATVAFYETAFGLTRRFIHEGGDYAEMDTGATTLAFAGEAFVATSFAFQPNRPSTPPAGSEVAFVTDDVAAAFTRALGAGAVAAVPPAAKPWGQVVSHVRDLNGFLVEICSPVNG